MSEDINEPETSERKICSCGYEDGTFACKIRHQGQPVIGWGRASQQ